MRIVVIGAESFIGRNLRFRLQEAGHVNAILQPSKERALPDDVAVVFDLTRNVRVLPQAVAAMPRGAALVCLVDAADDITELMSMRPATGPSLHLFRIAEVFGKWADPATSVVGRLCQEAAAGEPVVADDPFQPLRILHVDSVLDALVGVLDATDSAETVADIAPVYETTAGQVADIIRSFPGSRETLMTPPVGAGLTRALYVTYMSHLPPPAFAYQVPRYGDARGGFAEVLKTPDCGQFSYFTAPPGATRGQHYHHSKTEKFIVIRGAARFRFRHIETGERHELSVCGGDGQIVETAPGWAHDITNTGDDDLVVMLWANEIFDRARPDTIRMEMGP